MLTVRYARPRLVAPQAGPDIGATAIAALVLWAVLMFACAAVADADVSTPAGQIASAMAAAGLS